MKKPALLCLIAISASVLFAQEEAKSITRVALLVGSNSGGAGRPELRWAEKDARSFSSVLRELGGLEPRNEHLLLSPNKKTFLDEFSRIRSQTAAAKAAAARASSSKSDSPLRTEFVFYYSGHSDDEGLFLGADKIGYGDLKALIGTLDAQVDLVVLDSCSSGAITRLKGGTKAPPFLSDESSSLSGHAYLTSSSEYEATQESDKIQGSYFTYYLVAGLRGAADNSGDGRITLNEAYSHAFAETLARTENTRAGPQHPSYNIKLSGSGDLVLTDLRSGATRLIFDEALKGRVLLRDGKENLVAETLKSADKPLEFSLPAGAYSVTLISDGRVLKTKLSLAQGQAQRLGVATLTPVGLEGGVSRGDGDGTLGPEPSEISASKQPVDHWEQSSLMLWSFGDEVDRDRIGRRFALNFIAGKDYAIYGAQIGLGLDRVSADLAGVQATVGVNSVGGDAKGAQFSYGFNHVQGNLVGYQATSGVNYVRGDVLGVQNGIVNIASSFTGAQVGVVNVSGPSLGAGFSVVGVSGDTKGLWAGVVNVNKTFSGTELGVVNAGQRFSGFQLGVVNAAEEAHGVQIGVLNLFGTDDGYPIGLVSIVLRGGQTHLLSWMDSEGYACTGLVHGSRKVYNVYGGGYNVASGKTLRFMGIGYSLDLGKFYLNVEGLSGSSFSSGDSDRFDASPAGDVEMARVYAGYSFAEHFSLLAGTGYRWNISNGDNPGLRDHGPDFFVGVRL